MRDDYEKPTALQLEVATIFREASYLQFTGRKLQRNEELDEDCDGSFDNAVTAIEDAA